jgi:hypothetical protein
MHDKTHRPAVVRRLVPLTVLALLAAFAAFPALAAGKGPGYVDPDTFIRIAGDDRVLVQISISEALLGMITRSDPDLEELAGGLKSIEAVVLDLSRPGAAVDASDALLDTEKRLLRDGWERMVLVREEGGEVRILILPSDDKIQGLVVLIMDRGDGTMVFANIAGSIDLARLAEVGEGFGIPGLEDIEVEDDE